MRRFLLICLAAALSSVSCTAVSPDDFARVEDGRFVIPGDSPAYFVGTNMWYGPMLGVQGEGGDRDRLACELDFMKAAGITNLRVLVGSEGSPVHSKVVPILQPEAGVYDDAVLDGLDWFMAEIGKRGMFAVLFLTNSWEWSGGYSQYLEWSGRGKYPIPNSAGWDAFNSYVSGFHAVGADDEAKKLFENHVRFIVSRTNRYTDKPYTEDPAIFSWQIANEPRAFTDANKEEFARWIERTAKLLKSLDPNHMVSTGSEGEMGSEYDIALWERIHSYPEIDYANIHIWPLNWGWITRETLTENIDIAMDNAQKYIERHVALMEKYRKPVVLEEFGFPRDGFVFTPDSPTTLRDKFYGRVFELQRQSSAEEGLFAGSNFWAWGGFGKPSGVNTFWAKGDDYLGDPAQEEQGLNSVFAGDSTIELIAHTNSALEVIGKLGEAASSDRFLFGQQDFPFYGVEWEYEADRSDVGDIVGDSPAVLGVDLGEIELSGTKNLDGVPFERMRAEANRQFAKGGLVTISWHPRNPLTGGDAWDVSSDKVVGSILAGGSQHEKFMGWLDKVAEFISSLEGTVIFRPWHEHTKSWFWWGQELCTTEQYKQLWRMTLDGLSERGVTNFVTAYSPNISVNAEEYLERWPGDEYVDILGLDAYHFGGDFTAERFSHNLAENLAVMRSIAAEKHKLLALTETGAEGVPVDNWWTEVLLPAVKDSGVSYVLVWRNANQTKKENHFYAPYKGQASEADFRTFYDLDETVFLKGAKQL
jgi:mannan endo-1,4-beta-mannosidase